MRDAIPEVNGEPPVLAGSTCDAVICQECWHDGRLVEACNVAYLCFGGRWFRLYIDCGVVFWRPAPGAPEPFVAPEIGAKYPTVDVAVAHGIVGLRVVRYIMESTKTGARVAFHFENGRLLTFIDENDNTRWEVA